jgi:hypothetical protein
MSTPIDRAARKALAEAVRHLGSGQITNDEFESRIPRTTETNLHEVLSNGVWPLYDDLHQHKLSGSYALIPEGRTWIKRIILFLRSDAPYRYPRSTGFAFIPVVILSMLTLGWFGRVYIRYLWRSGDQSVWPFFSRQEYDLALADPVYLRGKRS